MTKHFQMDFVTRTVVWIVYIKKVLTSFAVSPPPLPQLNCGMLRSPNFEENQMVCLKNYFTTPKSKMAA